LLFSGPLVSKFYGRTELTGIMALIAISFVTEGLTIQHTALLRRNLKFTGVAIADILSRLSFLITGIVMALLNFSLLVAGRRPYSPVPGTFEFYLLFLSLDSGKDAERNGCQKHD
jgi:hypothetical protein